MIGKVFSTLGAAVAGTLAICFFLSMASEGANRVALAVALFALFLGCALVAGKLGIHRQGE